MSSLFPGADFERVAPQKCEKCGGADFDRKGRVALTDGVNGGGCRYEAVCLTCNAVWQAHADPFICRFHPEELLSKWKNR
jgi:hypothetical protein